MLWNAFPDIRITFEDMIAEQNKMGCRYYLSGTHRGEFLRHPPTNKKFKVHGMTIFAFQEGVIKQRWNVLDVLELIDQIKESSP